MAGDREPDIALALTRDEIEENASARSGGERGDGVSGENQYVWSPTASRCRLDLALSRPDRALAAGNPDHQVKSARVAGP